MSLLPLIYESFKVESVWEGDTKKIAVVKPRVGMTLLKGDSGSGSVHAAPRSTNGSGACLNCLYAKVRSMRNKQDELEALVPELQYHWC